MLAATTRARQGEEGAAGPHARLRHRDVGQSPFSSCNGSLGSSEARNRPPATTQMHTSTRGTQARVAHKHAWHTSTQIEMLAAS
eukprot:1918979-Pleurochrysis_carterae.AAC.1